MPSTEECIALVLALPEDERVKVIQALQATLPRHPVEVRLKTDTKTLLEAIARANPFTIRGIEGIIAEAVFALDVLPRLGGWRENPRANDAPFDFLLTRDAGKAAVRLQVKMQRRRNNAPLMAGEVLKTKRKWPRSSFVAEVQRTRGGKAASGKATRPYRFGEFDVLAISLGASTGYWGDFAFTVARWLLPDDKDPGAILKYQPVDAEESDDWTRSFDRVIEWLDSARAKTIRG
jgi:hypothetical protein